jgi:hypothetical protein
MAEIDPRNVVYNILAGKNELTAETEKSSKAINSLDKDIKETGKNVENSFKKGGEGLKNYTKLLQDAENKSKRLGREIREQEKITNDFQRRLTQVNQRLGEVGKNTVQFQRLTKEAKQLKEAITDNNVALRGLRIDKKQIDDSVTDLKRLSKESKEAAKGFEEIGNQAKSALPELGGITRALSAFGPAGVVASAAIGAVAGAFLLAKNRVRDFGESVDVTIAGLRGFANAYLNFAGQVAADIFRGRGVSGFFENLQEAAKQGRINIGLYESAERLFQRANADRIENIRTEATLTREIAEKRTQFTEQLKNGLRDETLIQEAIAKSNQLYDLQIDRQKDIVRGLGQILLSNKENLELQEAAQTAAAELEGLTAAKEDAKRQLLRSIKEGREASQKIVEIESGILIELRKQIEDLTKLRDTTKDPLRLIEIGEQIKQVSESLALYQDLVINGSKRIQEAANKVDLLKPDEVQLQADQLRVTLNKLKDEFSKLAFPESAIGKQLKNDIKALEDQISNIDPIAIKIRKSLAATGRFQTGLDQDKADEDAKQANIKRAQEEAAQLAQIAGDLTRAFLREEQERTDRQIQLAQDRVNAFRALAEKGSAEQLQLEEERLLRLTELREEQARKERIIAAAQIATANAVTIAEGIKNIVAGFKNPIEGIANAIALAAAVGATILALKNATSSIPAFAEGTEYVKLNGAPKGRDTVLARLDEGERVVPKKHNAMLNGIPNEKLVEAVKYYQFNQRVKDDAVRPSGSNNLPLIHEIRQMREDIRDMQMFLSVNEFGIAAGVQRANTKKKRIKNLARG